MVPAQATVYRQFVGLLIVEVRTDHLRRVQTLSATTETSATAATGESHVIGVVGIGHHKHLHVVLHHAAEETSCIAFLGTCCQVGVRHDSFVHASLDAEVEHRLLLAVLNTRDTSHIALLVVGLDAVNNVRRQVLHGGLRVTRHKLLAVHQDLFHFLTVDGNLAVVAHLGTGQTPYQLLDHGTLGRTIRRGIIDKGVGLQRHLGSLTGNGGPLQHDGIGL